MQDIGGVEAGIKLMEICPGAKIVLVTERVPSKTLEQLKAQAYHFETLPAPFSREELHAVVFGFQRQDSDLRFGQSIYIARTEPPS